MILVIGATGSVGRPLVGELIDEGAKVRALTRDPEGARARLPESVEAVRPEDGGTAAMLNGVTSVFLNVAGLGGLPVAELLREARQQGVRRVVTLSSSSVTYDDPDGTNAIAAHHRELETAVEDSGLEWAHVRPDAFAANARQWARQVRAGDTVHGPFADARTAPIHEADIAAVAARALLTRELLGQAPVLTGPESLSSAEQVRLIGAAVGRPVRYVEIPPGEARQAMAGSGMPAEAVDTLLRMFEKSVGRPAAVSPEVERITGRPGRTFAQWAEDHAADFR